MINPYKRLDVFRCNQEAHARFGGCVSVYHVLKEKQCYPQGCIYFKWHCALLEKGSPCIHRYQRTGKKCRGCTYFIEEKVHLQPERLLDEAAYDRFLEELEDFETWLEDNRFRRLNIAGRIHCVKPWYQQEVQASERHTRLRGYLIVFKNGYIGNRWFKDTLYIRVLDHLMNRYRFVYKMKIEMRGEIRENRGRIIVNRPGQIEIVKPGWGRPWTRDRALVAIKTSTKLDIQPDQCLACRWGALIDIVDRQEYEEKRYRNLYCLKSIQDWQGCYIYGMDKLKIARKRKRR